MKKEHGLFSIIPPGDMNMDTLIDANDVEPFVIALLDTSAYQTQRQAGTIGFGDMNLDGVLDGKDIQGFVQSCVSP